MELDLGNGQPMMYRAAPASHFSGVWMPILDSFRSRGSEAGRQWCIPAEAYRKGED